MARVVGLFKKIHKMYSKINNWLRDDRSEKNVVVSVFETSAEQTANPNRERVVSPEVFTNEFLEQCLVDSNQETDKFKKIQFLFNNFFTKDILQYLPKLFTAVQVAENVHVSLFNAHHKRAVRCLSLSMGQLGVFDCKIATDFILPANLVPLFFQYGSNGLITFDQSKEYVDASISTMDTYHDSSMPNIETIMFRVPKTTQKKNQLELTVSMMDRLLKHADTVRIIDDVRTEKSISYNQVRGELFLRWLEPTRLLDSFCGVFLKRNLSIIFLPISMFESKMQLTIQDLFTRFEAKKVPLTIVIRIERNEDLQLIVDIVTFPIISNLKYLKILLTKVKDDDLIKTGQLDETKKQRLDVYANYTEVSMIKTNSVLLYCNTKPVFEHFNHVYDTFRVNRVHLLLKQSDAQPEDILNCLDSNPQNVQMIFRISLIDQQYNFIGTSDDIVDTLLLQVRFSNPFLVYDMGHRLKLRRVQPFLEHCLTKSSMKLMNWQHAEGKPCKFCTNPLVVLNSDVFVQSEKCALTAEHFVKLLLISRMTTKWSILNDETLRMIALQL